MLKVARFEILDVEIPFRMSFKHSIATRSRGHSVIVRAVDHSGAVGHGECVPREYVTGESPATVRSVLRNELAPRLVGRAFDAFGEVVEALAGAEELPRDGHAAYCAIELALLDLAGRVFEVSVGEAVAGPLVHETVAYSAVVSAESPRAILGTLKNIAGQGFERVKIKVGSEEREDLELLRETRRIVGDRCGLRIDANCAWRAEQALDTLRSFEPFRLEAVEQPLAANDLDGLAWLTARSPVPVIVDESLVSLADARALIERRACHHFNLRISKCGGLIRSVRLRELGRKAGIGCQLGAQVGETAILSAAGRQLATRTCGMLFQEGSYGSILLEADVGAQDVTIGRAGRAPALAGSGLGVDVSRERLERYTTGRVVVRAS